MVQIALRNREVALIRGILDVADTARQPATATTLFEALDLLCLLVHGDDARAHGADAVRERHFYSAWAREGVHGIVSAEELALENALGGVRFYWSHYWKRRWSQTDRTGLPDFGSLRTWHSPSQWKTDAVINQIWPSVADQAFLTYPVGPGRSVTIRVGRRTGKPFDQRELVLLSLLHGHLGPLATGVVTPQPDLLGLTTRQKEILDLVRQGLSNRHIANALGISEATVRKHLEHSFERLGVQSRTAAVAAFSPDLETETATTSLVPRT